MGLFEGAHYYHCGAFRPEFHCRMRALGNPFCAVCRREIERVIDLYAGREAEGGRREARTGP